MKIRSGPVVALFAFNVSVSLSWLNTTLATAAPMLQRENGRGATHQVLVEEYTADVNISTAAGAAAHEKGC